MTSGEKAKELQKKMTGDEIQKFAKQQMQKFLGKDVNSHNFWMRVHNNAFKSF